MIKQEIIRDKNYNIIEEIDNCGKHIKYNTNGDIIYYKSNNLEYPLPFNNIESPQEQEFVDLMKNSIIKVDEIEYPGVVFMFKNGKYLFEYNSINRYFWFSYRYFWSVLQKKYSMDNQQMEDFLKDMVEKHFNCKDITPIVCTGRILSRVEKHFNK